MEMSEKMHLPSVFIQSVFVYSESDVLYEIMLRIKIVCFNFIPLEEGLY